MPGNRALSVEEETRGSGRGAGPGGDPRIAEGAGRRRYTSPSLVASTGGKAGASEGPIGSVGSSARKCIIAAFISVRRTTRRKFGEGRSGDLYERLANEEGRICTARNPEETTMQRMTTRSKYGDTESDRKIWDNLIIMYR